MASQRVTPERFNRGSSPRFVSGEHAEAPLNARRKDESETLSMNTASVSRSLLFVSIRSFLSIETEDLAVLAGQFVYLLGLVLVHK